MLLHSRYCWSVFVLACIFCCSYSNVMRYTKAKKKNKRKSVSLYKAKGPFCTTERKKMFSVCAVYNTSVYFSNKRNHMRVWKYARLNGNIASCSNSIYVVDVDTTVEWWWTKIVCLYWLIAYLSGFLSLSISSFALSFILILLWYWQYGITQRKLSRHPRKYARLFKQQYGTIRN